MQTQPMTNALSNTTARALAQLADLDQGTLVSARVHKMGDARGSSGSKIIYGDDYVHVLMWAGFSYQALIKRSQKMLQQQLAKGGYIEKLARATLETHSSTTISDVCAALQETQEWFRKATGNSDFSDPPTSSVWEPLTVGGMTVRGARVYTGPDRPDDQRAPVPGTIYIQGVKLGEKVLTHARNGAWRADSKPKTIAKGVIKGALPVGLYCQYRLEPERVDDVCVAEDASKAAKGADIPINPDALRALFKIAP